VTNIPKSSVTIDCTRCNGITCCEEGYLDIYLTQKEILRISETTHKRTDEFIETYWNPFLGRSIFTLSTPCPFYMERRCNINELKPLVCEIFPFTLDVLTHTISIEKYHCKNIVSGNELSRTSKQVSIDEYRKKIKIWLEDFWK